jgi:hypothetical protein
MRLYCNLCVTESPPQASALLLPKIPQTLGIPLGGKKKYIDLPSLQANPERPESSEWPAVRILYIDVC